MVRVAGAVQNLEVKDEVKEFGIESGRWGMIMV